MNPDDGTFHPVTDVTPADWIRFTVGERLKVKGILMQIASVGRDAIELRPVVEPKQARGNRHARRRSAAEKRHQLPR